jgi:hypothetical protein
MIWLGANLFLDLQSVEHNLLFLQNCKMQDKSELNLMVGCPSLRVVQVTIKLIA